ncbi:7608_t:CDS:2, partial [Acaulospora colombiana]
KNNSREKFPPYGQVSSSTFPKQHNAPEVCRRREALTFKRTATRTIDLYIEISQIATRPLWTKYRGIHQTHGE